jgi:hypothetical protein
VADLQAPLVEELEVDEETGRLHHDSDLIITRGATDVIVTGKARPPSRTNSFVVSIAVGDFRRDIVVFGERRLEPRADGTVTFSRAALIDEVPLTWDEAYGGVDRVGLEEIGDPFVEIAAKTDSPIGPTQSLFAYPRNPFGKGYLIEPSPAALDACRLPRLEHPWSRVTAENVIRRHYVTWPLAPIPAGVGWLGYSAFPRSAQLGLPAQLYDQGTIDPTQFHEVSTGTLRPEALDPDAPIDQRIDVMAIAQGSATSMRAPKVLPGAEVTLTNVHRKEPAWSFRLPREVPRMAYRLSKNKAEQMVPQIHSLVLDVERDLVTIMWVGCRALEVPLTPGQQEAIEHGVVWP